MKEILFVGVGNKVLVRRLIEIAQSVQGLGNTDTAMRLRDKK